MNTLVALALLAALWTGFSYWEKRKNREGPKTESAPQQRILSVDSSHIRAFSLKPRAGETVACQQQGGNWVLVAPQKLPADHSSVSGFLSSLTGASIDQTADERPTNLKDFGLDPPAMTIEVATDTRPEKLTLLLGDETPTGGGIYAQISGSPRVVTLPSYLKSSLEKNAFDLRDKQAVSLDLDRLQRIEVDGKGKKWILAKNPEGIWDLVLPPPVRADRFAVDNLVDQLRGLSMQSVVAEDKKSASKYGLATPELRVYLSGAGHTQSLLIGKREGDRVYAMSSALDSVFTLGADFLTQFQKGPADLLEKRLFSFSAFDAKRVEMETPKGRRVFEKQKDKWKQTAPVPKDIPTDKMETFLSRVSDLRAEAFPKNHPEDLAAFGLKKPAYLFQVEFGEKNQEEVVEAAKVGDHEYARRSTDLVACELPKTALDEIEKALGEL